MTLKTYYATYKTEEMDVVLEIIATTPFDALRKAKEQEDKHELILLENEYGEHVWTKLV